MSASRLRQRSLLPEQVIFLECMRCAGGVALMACDCRDVLRELKKYQVPKKNQTMSAQPMFIENGNGYAISPAAQLP